MTSFHRNTWITASTLFVFTICDRMFMCGQVPENESPKAAQPNQVIVIQPSSPDPMILAENIEKWLEELKNPASGDTEASAVTRLFGNLFHCAYDPPKKIKEFLLKQRLGYKHWQARRAAAYQFQYFLEHDVETLIDIMRDGLNDLHPEVRGQALTTLGRSFLRVRPHVRPGEEWDRAAKARFLEKRDDYADEIIDLIITKGLTDENLDVVGTAIGRLEIKSVKPTAIRLRALERILAAEDRIRFPEAREVVREIRKKWKSVIDSDKEKARKNTDVPFVPADLRDDD